MVYSSNGNGQPPRTAITVPHMVGMKGRGEKITMLTAYDASLATQMELAGLDTVLVGDSLGMVIQGKS